MKKYIRLFLFYSFCLFLSVSFAQKGSDNHLVYPKIHKRPTTEIHYGNKVIDEYSNLKKLEDSVVKDWFKAQDSLAESYFVGNDLMKEYLNRFKKLQNNAESSVSMIRISEVGNYFYLKYDDSLEYEKLFFRENLADNEKELFDPSQDGKEDLSITYLRPSFDGKKIAIGFNENGNFSSKVLIFDLEKKQILKDVITNINPDFGGIEWLPDSSGFIYLYFPEVDKSKPGYKKNSFSVIHKLGENPENRKPIFQANEDLQIPEDFYPKVKIGSSLDKYIIGYAASSDDYYDSYIAKIPDVLQGKPDWMPFFQNEDAIFYDQGEVRGEDFIFRQGNLNGNLLGKVSIKDPDFNNPIVLAEGNKENPIVKFEVTKDHIYFARSLYGANVSLYVQNSSNEIKQLQPPFDPGYASFFGESAKHNNIGVGMDGWTSDYTRYLINEDGSFSREALSPLLAYPEFENIITEQIMVTSHDGVEVPLSLVYKEGLKKKSANEVFIYVYGAYGESMSPFFSPLFLDWAAQGGILAFPHVRGGGEKGKEWHEQGMKNLKYNSWKDLIACTEALINLNLTAPGLISLYTSSAGGITAGMAVNERPDLYSSFIAEVPRLNPLGLESSSTASSTSYLEYGTVKDSTEFIGLVRMDPYLNVRSEISYPAVLVMPSYNDDRIPLWDSGKYIAKLQNSYQINNPFLMDIDYQNGHETVGDYDESVRLYSKIFSFAKSNMKH
ncbi:prolyl oligopeptidase family serine peptidase [uncultured Christiangramia sp.]|uniref:prolyl oligopeptidase family serine peptidase n=1 Tax=Christiangramia sp. 3-2217-3z TaxID=3417564 RepID=UPI0026036127|nr:prolyl oligopeptidase family serine peptidase [uncultured Christiangramia sp.]